MTFIMTYLIIGIITITVIILSGIDAVIETIEDNKSNISFWSIVGIIVGLIVAAIVWPYWMYLWIKAMCQS